MMKGLNKKTCQFCGIKKIKTIENWVKHVYFGLICSECIKSDIVKKRIKQYNIKKGFNNE